MESSVYEYEYFAVYSFVLLFGFDPIPLLICILVMPSLCNVGIKYYIILNDLFIFTINVGYHILIYNGLRICTGLNWKLHLCFPSPQNYYDRPPSLPGCSYFLCCPPT